MTRLFSLQDAVLFVSNFFRQLGDTATLECKLEQFLAYLRLESSNVPFVCAVFPITSYMYLILEDVLPNDFQPSLNPLVCMITLLFSTI